MMMIAARPRGFQPPSVHPMARMVPAYPSYLPGQIRIPLQSPKQISLSIRCCSGTTNAAAEEPKSKGDAKASEEPNFEKSVVENQKLHVAIFNTIISLIKWVFPTLYTLLTVRQIKFFAAGDLISLKHKDREVIGLVKQVGLLEVSVRAQMGLETFPISGSEIRNLTSHLGEKKEKVWGIFSTFDSNGKDVKTLIGDIQRFLAKVNGLVTPDVEGSKPPASGSTRADCMMLSSTVSASGSTRPDYNLVALDSIYPAKKIIVRCYVKAKDYNRYIEVRGQVLDGIDRLCKQT